VNGPDDRNWVQAARGGSSAAFSQLVSVHQAGLIAFLRRLCINPAEAEDIAQETFLFAWRALSRFDPDRSFRAWLFGIGLRKSREDRRGLLRRLRRQATAIEQAPGVIAADLGTRLDLSAAVNSLPDNERASVLLCLMAGFSHEEAAQVMGLTTRNLKSLVARARGKLSEMMGDNDAGQ
jgi:RNA polymerase sigma-70 factor (ECF subfamily)